MRRLVSCLAGRSGRTAVLLVIVAAVAVGCAGRAHPNRDDKGTADLATLTDPVSR